MCLLDAPPWLERLRSESLESSLDDEKLCIAARFFRDCSRHSCVEVFLENARSTILCTRSWSPLFQSMRRGALFDGFTGP